MTTPYNPAFIDLLHAAVPSSDRSWDKPAKTWTFSEKYLDAVQKAAETVFRCKAQVLSKQDAQKAPPSTAVVVRSSLPDLFFELVPYEAMRKAYVLGIAFHHPDKGGDADKAARLNAIWQKLEREFYKKGGT